MKASIAYRTKAYVYIACYIQNTIVRPATVSNVGDIIPFRHFNRLRISESISSDFRK